MAAIPVVVYHSVVPGQKLSVNNTSPGKFRNQMERWLDAGVRFLTPSEYFSREGKQEENEQLMMLTLDDGYADTIENALPILIDLRIPALFFIPVGWLGKNNDWDPARFGRKSRHVNADEVGALLASGQ